jgi:hypothetical protein
MHLAVFAKISMVAGSPANPAVSVQDPRRLVLFNSTLKTGEFWPSSHAVDDASSSSLGSVAAAAAMGNW